MGENQNNKNCFKGLGNIEIAGYAKVSMKIFKPIIPQVLLDTVLPFYSALIIRVVNYKSNFTIRNRVEPKLLRKNLHKLFLVSK